MKNLIAVRVFNDMETARDISAAVRASFKIINLSDDLKIYESCLPNQAEILDLESLVRL